MWNIRLYTQLVLTAGYSCLHVLCYMSLSTKSFQGISDTASKCHTQFQSQDLFIYWRAHYIQLWVRFPNCPDICGCSSPNGIRLGRCTESRAQNVCSCFHLKDVWKCIRFLFLIRMPHTQEQAISVLFFLMLIKFSWMSYFYATGNQNFSIRNHVCASKNIQLVIQCF